MPIYQALGTGPVTFLDSNDTQREIPLSAIAFTSSGVSASSWPLYTANQKVVDALLAQLVSEGYLVQGTQTAASPSLTITAAQAGSNGNAISINFSNPNTTAGTVTVAVNATEVYPGLSSSTIATAIGTSAATANGLVFLQANNNNAPVAFTGTIGGAGTIVVPDAANDAAGAFTLEATDTSYTVNVAVTLDPAPATTFTLTVTGSKTASNTTPATLEGNTNPFALLVTFTGASGAPLPAPGTITLQGGAAASSSPATKATATAFAT